MTHNKDVEINLHFLEKKELFDHPKAICFWEKREICFQW